MLLSPPPDAAAEPEVLPLTPAARGRRTAAVFVVLALLLTGSVWGDDDAFPFGPFRMYSTRTDPDAAVISTRAVGMTATGDEVKLSGGQVGLRRAEFEGQVRRIAEHPELLGLLADAFAESHPDAPELVSVRVVQRRHQLSDGKPTGDHEDRVVAEYELGEGDR